MKLSTLLTGLCITGLQVASAETAVIDAKGCLNALGIDGEYCAIRASLRIPEPGWDRSATQDSAANTESALTDDGGAVKGRIDLGEGRACTYEQTVEYPADGSLRMTYTVTPGAESVLIITSGSSYTAGDVHFVITATGGGLTHTVGGVVTLGFGLVPTCYGRLSGSVTDSSNGQPIGGATVQYNISEVTSTAADGTYTSPNDVTLGPNSGAATQIVTIAANGYYQQQFFNVVVACGRVSLVNAALVPTVHQHTSMAMSQIPS